MAAASQRRNVERAAIVLLSVGEQAAGEILKHLDSKDVQVLLDAMTKLSAVSQDETSTLLADFARAAHEASAVSAASPAFVREALVRAFGEQQAEALLARMSIGQNAKGLEALKWAEPKSVADLVRGEHPQTIAILLAYLDPDRASKILMLLPEAIRPDILFRLSTLESVHPSALAALDTVLERQLRGGGQTASLGGPKFAANLMTHLDTGSEKSLLQALEKVDGDLAAKIESLMFVFEDLLEVDDRGIQALLREVTSTVIATALAGADERMRNKIFQNMSKRAAETLKDDMEVQGPVRLSEVDVAQKQILAAAKRLQETGEIMLGPNRDTVA